MADISWDQVSQPKSVAIHIKASKTDPFRKGVTIYLGGTGRDLCPVAALIDYINTRGYHEGPLFCFKDFLPCKRFHLVQKLRSVLANFPSIKEKDYCGHSFRIGAATTAAKRGIKDSMIKILGRWESSAYQLYIRTPRSELTRISKQLVSED